MGGMIRRCRVGQQFRLFDGTVITVVSIQGRREVKLHVASPKPTPDGPPGTTGDPHARSEPSPERQGGAHPPDDLTQAQRSEE